MLEIKCAYVWTQPPTYGFILFPESKELTIKIKISKGALLGWNCRMGAWRQVMSESMKEEFYKPALSMRLTN
jgi:hypothetical protein